MTDARSDDPATAPVDPVAPDRRSDPLPLGHARRRRRAALLSGAADFGAGFDCHRVDRGGTPNLFARWGAGGANRSFGFNGHTDVVPVGDAAAWTQRPVRRRDRRRLAVGARRHRHEIGRRGLCRRGDGFRARNARPMAR